MSDYTINGHCDERFTPVREAFTRNFDDGLELGAAFAISLGGEMVVDLWGGFARSDGTGPWAEDTIAQVASTSKIMISICGLLLVDRGLIDLDAPVSKYWPEFAGGGKKDLRVRYIFCHATGLPALDGMPGWDVLDDWEEVIRRLEKQEPWWEPGTKSGYQGHVYGHLVGELVKRTTGQTIGDFFNNEIAGPFDIDFSFGLTKSDRHRMAHRVQENSGDFESEMEKIDQTSVQWRALGYTFTPKGNIAYMLAKHGITNMNVPAANGVTNARAMAKIGGIMAAGGAGSSGRLMSAETASLPWKEQIYTRDEVIESPVRFGVGFGISSDEFPFAWPNTYHWGGFGGSFCAMVPEVGAAFAYTPNKIATDGAGILDVRGEALKAAAETSLLGIQGKP